MTHAAHRCSDRISNFEISNYEKVSAATESFARRGKLSEAHFNIINKYNFKTKNTRNTAERKLVSDNIIQ